MPTKANIFQHESALAFDRRHRAILQYNIGKYDTAVAKGKLRYRYYDEARRYASDIKTESLVNLADHLELFESTITRRGAKVLWARDAREAMKYAAEILKKHSARSVVKSKSMITEEVHFNESLEATGIEPVETDLGEFIVQVAGQKPYHILTPAMHKSKEDVSRLFHEKFDTPQNSTPAELAAFVRQRLRPQYAESEVGVTGANFIVADVGGIALTENEGNGLMSMSLPKVHLVFAGIERVIPGLEYLPFFWQWLSVHGTGQNISAYNSLLLGPRKEGETDGPEEMYVILLDNGRTTLLESDHAWEALRCIRCGACLNACPVYRHIGGYTYNTTYTGPIGSVITPFLSGFSDFGHLSEASTLCGKCTDVCPVKIPLHQLLLNNRRIKVSLGEQSVGWKLGIKGYAYLFGRRRRLDAIRGGLKKRLTPLAAGQLGNHREFPQFAHRSFSQQWKSIHKTQ